MDDHDQSWLALKNLAERELGAFLKVVTDCYGSEQAGISAEDWLSEFESIDAPPESAGELRLVTIAAAKRLAARLTARGEHSTVVSGLRIEPKTMARSYLPSQ